MRKRKKMKSCLEYNYGDLHKSILGLVDQVYRKNNKQNQLY